MASRSVYATLTAAASAYACGVRSSTATEAAGERASANGGEDPTSTPPLQAPPPTNTSSDSAAPGAPPERPANGRLKELAEAEVEGAAPKAAEPAAGRMNGCTPYWFWVVPPSRKLKVVNGLNENPN